MKYTYNKIVKISQLTNEIRQSSIVTALDFITLSDTNLEINFKSAISSSDEIILNTLVNNHVINDIPEVDIVSVKEFQITGVNRIPKVAAFEPEGDSATIVSHDFTDKCSWYNGSVQITGETLNTSDSLTFTSSRTHWIDLTHGRMYDEDNINVGGMYNPVIRIDGVIQSSGFTINYEAGSIVFGNVVSGVVTADFRYANTSFFTVKPKPGKILSIRTAEVQFTQDVNITNPFIFEAWVNHPQFGMIPVPGSRIAYKNAKDFMSACNGGTSWIEPWGNIGQKTYVFPFDYARPKPLKASQGVEIRVYIMNHQEVAGSFATCTFYVTVENEVL